MKIKALAAIILTFGIASICAVPANAAPNNFATGSGVVAFSIGDDPLGFGRISVNAQVGVGESRVTATGQVQLQIPGGGTVHGTVNCLLVRGENQAGLSGILDEPVDGNRYFRLSINDNDGTGTNTPDQADVVLFTEPFGCARFLAETPVENGNFVVRGEKG